MRSNSELEANFERIRELTENKLSDAIRAVIDAEYDSSPTFKVEGEDCKQGDFHTGMIAGATDVVARLCYAFLKSATGDSKKDRAKIARQLSMIASHAIADACVQAMQDAEDDK